MINISKSISFNKKQKNCQYWKKHKHRMFFSTINTQFVDHLKLDRQWKFDKKCYLIFKIKELFLYLVYTGYGLDHFMIVTIYIAI